MDITEEEVALSPPADKTKQAYVKILQFLTDNFYSDGKQKIDVTLSNKGEEHNYYDQQSIVLSEQIVDAFGALNLPRFVVYYHELGHYLYSKGLFDLVDAWVKINAGALEWKKGYHHLLNWIEDYYIENCLKKEHPYLTDVLNCIKRLPPDYDIKAIEYAFNYWYINETPTPALQYLDQVTFKSYIMRLLTMREGGKTRFGQGVLTTLSIKQTNDTKFALLLIEFYNWCVSIGILPKDQTMPPLQNPNNHLEMPGADDGSDMGDDTGGDQGQNSTNNKKQGEQGSSSDHSHNVGTNSNLYREVTPVQSATTIFKDELVQENKLIAHELLDMSQRVDSINATLDGLFNTKDHDSAIIQSKVIVPNFFNPCRLMDQILFREKDHTYMNVAIYRDISGSTTGKIHTLMSAVCDKLYEDIPVDVTYYLYASGKISIIEAPYVQWDDSSNIPNIYMENPLFRELRGGTNSGAIADVITQQLSDKWLNIIITDGDLYDLMGRDNIYGLLKNVFVISVSHDLGEGLQGVTIKTKEDIACINNVLGTINLD